MPLVTVFKCLVSNKIASCAPLTSLSYCLVLSYDNSVRVHFRGAYYIRSQIVSDCFFFFAFDLIKLMSFKVT